MNEDISRILDMVEKGTITADEAERLIRVSMLNSAAGTRSFRDSASESAPFAFREGSTEHESAGREERALDDLWDPFSPFSNPLPDLQDITRVFRRIGDRLKRHHMRRYWWNYFRLNRWYEHRRTQRRAAMSTYERVRFVLLGAPAHSEFVIQAQTDIPELLERDRIAWDLFRFGLEEEFGIELSMDQARAFRTVQDVVDYVDYVEKPADTPGATEGSAPGEPASDSTPEVEPAKPATPVKPGRRAPSEKRG